MMPGETYVALGSSMAAGPGIRPRAAGSPFPAARSARNYPHLAAAELGLTLRDVTYSGATTAHLLTDRQNGAPPQIEAVDTDTALVTITIGGNDIGYVPALSVAALPGLVRHLPVLGGLIDGLLDPRAREHALATLGSSLQAVGSAVRAAAPRARVLFVDYLTLLPPAGAAAPPLSAADAELGRHLAARLAEITADAAAQTGCELVSASAASRDHHAWSPQPWTVGATIPLPWRPAPFHPNAAGMAAVARLVVETVRTPAR